MDSGSSRRSRSSNGERDYHHADGAKRLRIDAPSETDNRDRRYAAEVEQQWPSHKIVKLNVGGQKYTTTVATLRRARGSLLEAMFSNTTIPAQDEEGAYFIDRDGTFFSLILNFLRDGSVELPTDGTVLRAVLREAQFYQLTGLVNQIQLALGLPLSSAPLAPRSPMPTSPRHGGSTPRERDRERERSVSVKSEPREEPVREHTRESVREPMREHTRDSVREPVRESLRELAREPAREPVREDAQKIKGTSRLASHTIVDEGKVTRVITCIDFDPTGDYFAASQLSERISIYSYTSFVNARESVPLAAQTLPIKSNMSTLSWNKSVRHLLAHGDHDGNICLWNTEIAQPVSTFQEHTKRVWCVSFASAAHHKQFASASDDRTVRLWTIDDKTSTASIASKATVCCVRYSPNDSMLAFSSADHHVHCYDLRNLKSPFAILRDHRKAVWALSFLNQEQLVSASVDGTIKRWHMHKGTPLMSYSGHANAKNFTGLTVDRTGEHIICGSEDNQVYLWNVDTPTPLTTYSFGELGSSPKWVSTVATRPGSNVIVGGNSAGDVHVFRPTY